MSHQHWITSVVLHYAAMPRVPLLVFDRVTAWFESLGLSPTLFTATGDNFLADDCYLLADGSEPTFRWSDPEPIWPCRSELIQSLTAGEIRSLSLDVPRDDGRERSGLSMRDLFDQARLLGAGWCDVRYGFAYQMSQSEYPGMHAIGAKVSKWPGKEAFIRERMAPPPPPTSDDLWLLEPFGKKRHLVNRFRDAYPLNVLSHDHVEAAGLKTDPIGKLTPWNDSLWLWELLDEELPKARQLLAEKRLLVSSD
jgi:hypothetical protein